MALGTVPAMSLTPSTMLELGTPAPAFSLPDTGGSTVSLGDFSDARGLLVMFICNHCPYVKLIRQELAAIGREYCPKGVAMVAISSNDAGKYPADSPEKMAEEARSAGYPFPYLYDETQEIARAYRAACTPDFFLYDQARTLVYRGQFDDARPENGRRVTGRDLRAALDCVLNGTPISTDQKPSMGCNIKWKPGNDPR